MCFKVCEIYSKIIQISENETIVPFWCLLPLNSVYFKYYGTSYFLEHLKDYKHNIDGTLLISNIYIGTPCVLYVSTIDLIHHVHRYIYIYV